MLCRFVKLTSGDSRYPLHTARVRFISLPNPTPSRKKLWRIKACSSLYNQLNVSTIFHNIGYFRQNTFSINAPKHNKIYLKKWANKYFIPKHIIYQNISGRSIGVPNARSTLLTSRSKTVSLSSSVSQESPMVSPSLSSCPLLGMSWQLSCRPSGWTSGVVL